MEPYVEVYRLTALHMGHYPLGQFSMVGWGQMILPTFYSIPQLAEMGYMLVACDRIEITLGYVYLGELGCYALYELV